MRRTQPQSLAWKSRAPRWATKASPGGASRAAASRGADGSSTESGKAWTPLVPAGDSAEEAVGAIDGTGSGSLISRVVSIVSLNSSLARLNSRMARPSERPSCGRFFWSMTRRATTKMRISSWRPMSNMTETNHTTAAGMRRGGRFPCFLVRVGDRHRQHVPLGGVERDVGAGDAELVLEAERQRPLRRSPLQTAEEGQRLLQGEDVHLLDVRTLDRTRITREVAVDRHDRKERVGVEVVHEVDVHVVAEPRVPGR